MLWSHYGDKHRGICLGFDVPDEMLEPIDYVESMELVDLNLIKSINQLDENFMKKIIFQKFKDWRYEEEYRGWAGLDEKDSTTGLFSWSFLTLYN